MRQALAGSRSKPPRRDHYEMRRPSVQKFGRQAKPSRAEIPAKPRGPGYTGCQRPRQPGYPSAAARSLEFSDRLEPVAAMDSFEMNKIMGAVLGLAWSCCRSTLPPMPSFQHPEAEGARYRIDVPTSRNLVRKPRPRRMSRSSNCLPRPMPSAASQQQTSASPGHTFAKGDKKSCRSQSLRRCRPSEGSVAGFNYSAA